MKYITTLVLIGGLSFSYAQTMDNLDVNNINATINLIDGAFQNVATGSPGFEAPKGFGNHTIYAQGMWIGGSDINGQLKLAVQGFGGHGRDFRPSHDPDLNRLFKVDKDTIDYHVNNYTNPGYTAPTQISEWPAHGDSSYNMDFYLAPFVDMNQDGLYDPMDGDYPKIKCDQAIWWYMSDDTTHTLSNSDPIGIDVHCMAYACNCAQDSALQNTIFIEYTIINRGVQTLSDVWVGNWVDFDIGCSGDDFLGSHVEKGVFYAYNSDLIDDSNCNGTLPYGPNLPATGAMVFGPKQDADGMDNPGPSWVNSYYVDYSTATSNSGICYKGQGHYYDDGIVDNERLGLRKFGALSLTGNPNNANEYYNVLTGNDVGGVPWQYGGAGLDVQMVFPDSSDSEFWNTQGNPTNAWTEETFSNQGGDRRGLGSSGPFTLVPGQVEAVTFAYIFGNDYTANDNKSSIDVVLNRADDISRFIEHNLDCSQMVSTENISAEPDNFELYPNPASDILSVKFNELPVIIEVYDQLGKLLIVEQPKSMEVRMNISMLPAGIYIVKATNGMGSVSTQKMVKQ